MVIYCSKCGKQVHEKAKYCPFCGEPVLINKDLPDEEAVNEIVEPKVEETPIQEAAPQPQYQEAPIVTLKLNNINKRLKSVEKEKRQWSLGASLFLRYSLL